VKPSDDRLAPLPVTRSFLRSHRRHPPFRFPQLGRAEKTWFRDENSIGNGVRRQAMRGSAAFAVCALFRHWDPVRERQRRRDTTAARRSPLRGRCRHAAKCWRTASSAGWVVYGFKPSHFSDGLRHFQRLRTWMRREGASQTKQTARATAHSRQRAIRDATGRRARARRQLGECLQ